MATYPVTLSMWLCPFCLKTATFCLARRANQLQSPHRCHGDATSVPQSL